jgi:transcriptional regulator with XRE-family HTH domain
MEGKRVTLTGNQVKAIRAVMGLSQAALAAKLAVTQPVIFRIERRGDETLTGPEIILIDQIARQAGVDVDALSVEAAA